MYNIKTERGEREEREGEGGQEEGRGKAGNRNREGKINGKKYLQWLFPFLKLSGETSLLITWFPEML